MSRRITGLLLSLAAACGGKVAGNPDTTTATYAWTTGDFDLCDAPGLCGSGSRSRVVRCVSDRGAAVDDSFCTTMRPTSDEPCSATTGCFWQADAVGDCNALNACSAGVETRIVACRNIFGTEVDPTWCSDPAPDTSGGCLRTSGCTWDIGTFGACDVDGCGESQRTRPVACVDTTDNVVSSSWCPSPAPQSSVPCQDFSSCVLAISDWAACSASCGYGTHTRTVTCETPAGAPVQRSWCPASSTPTAEACTDTANCCSQPALEAAPFAGGSGTSASPYIVCTAAQLDQTRTALGSTYILGRDIDLLGVIFVPIGSTTNPFRGVFDGASHSLLRWTYSAPDTDQVGLFTYGSGATVKQLRLEDMAIQGRAYVGALFGSAVASTISDVTITGSVRGTTEVGALVGELFVTNIADIHANATVTGTTDTGGIIGSASYSNIAFCDTAGAVSGTQYVGGIVGTMSTQANVVACTSSASVEGDQYVGGVVGLNGGNALVRASSSGSVMGGSAVGGIAGLNQSGVFDSWSTGAVSAASDVGGLVGNNSGRVGRSYSSGAVSGTTNVGGLIGRSSGEVRRGFWDVQSSTQATSAGGLGLTSEAMRSPETYAEWDTYLVWQIQNGQRPSFRTEPRACTAGASAFSGGLGTQASPFIVDRASQLYDINCNLSSSYVLGASIDFTGIPATPPIGSIAPVTAPRAQLQPSPFSGTFDGAGFTISRWSGYGYRAGLFVSASNTTIKNLLLADAEVGGGTYVGILAGSASNSTISNVAVQGDLFGNYVVGGLVGDFSGTLTRASTNVDTNGAGYVGGMIGFCNSANVSNTYALGSLVARGAFGGFSRGGFGGGGNGNGGCNVTNSYAAVALSGTNVSGFATGASSTSSFWDTNVSGPTSGGTGTGKTTSEMQTQSTFVGWDFDTVWRIEPGSYPTLR